MRAGYMRARDVFTNRARRLILAGSLLLALQDGLEPTTP